ncbi:MAG: peptide transporter, partial [Burkholderiaceae bacterium]
IAVAATTMKLNPNFLKACRGIQERAQAAQASVQFVFLVGQAIGLLYPSVKQVIQSYLPTAEVWGHQAYPDYLEKMASCDFFLSPFPFGNTNGIIDAVSIGLNGICKTGPEVFEHIDEGLFRRLGFPDNQIAKTVEDYVNAACSKIHSQHLENTPEAKRARIQALQDTIYSGDQTALGTTLCSKLFTAQG